jgi:hypothetical protein
MVVRIAGDEHIFVERADERSDGLAGLKRVAMSSERFQNLEADMARAQSDMRGITEPKIDVTHFVAGDRKDPEMIGRDEAASWFAGNDPDKSQLNGA